MSELIDEFRNLKNDVERWKRLIKNQGKGLVVYLDNDYTLVVDTNSEDEDGASFDDYIDGLGAFDLLDAIGVSCESV